MLPRPLRDQSLTAVTSIRPLRVAVVLDSSSATARSDFEEIAVYFARLWGGLYNTVGLAHEGILTPSTKRLLALLDPDHVYSVPELRDDEINWITRHIGPYGIDNGITTRRDHGGSLIVPQLVRETPVRVTSIPRAISSRQGHLFSPRFHLVFGQWRDDPYKRFLAANFGCLPPEAAMRDAFQTTQCEEHDLSSADSQAVFETLTSHRNYETFYPSTLSRYGTTPPPANNNVYSHTFTLVVGDSVTDLFLFRAISMLQNSQMGPRCTWFPPSLLDDSDAIDCLAKWIRSLLWQDPRHCKIVCRDLPRQDLAALVAALARSCALEGGVHSQGGSPSKRNPESSARGFARKMIRRSVRVSIRSRIRSRDGRPTLVRLVPNSSTVESIDRRFGRARLLSCHSRNSFVSDMKSSSLRGRSKRTPEPGWSRTTPSYFWWSSTTRQEPSSDLATNLPGISSDRSSVANPRSSNV